MSHKTVKGTRTFARNLKVDNRNFKLKVVRQVTPCTIPADGEVVSYKLSVNGGSEIMLDCYVQEPGVSK